MRPETTARRALLTGATGYIGSRLAARLVRDGWEVHVVARPGSSLALLEPVSDKLVVHEFDGTTARMIELVKAAAPSVVFHLASLFLAQHKPEDIEALVDSNLLFSTQLVEAMLHNGVRQLVNTGTSWQHYENADFNPVNLYAATKQAFEALLAYYIEAHALKVSSLMLFDTYGPGDPRPKLIPMLWKCAASQQPLAMSPGEQLIDLVHVDDVVEAFLAAELALRTQQGGHVHYAVSSGKPMRLKDLVSVFEHATGTRLAITWGGRPYRLREVMVPWTDHAGPPGWQPRISFVQGVPATAPT
jgi:nucleoside-diphosphate-sugar epimerase